MNRKGFTLIELIATIALLAIIAVISFVSVNKVIIKNRDENCKALVNSIITAANEYASDNRYNSEFANRISNNQLTITARELIRNNYLSADIINPYDNNDVIPANQIGITINFNADYTVNNVNVSLPIEQRNCGA